MSVDLGKFQKVQVRVLWKHEEQDFTPWLAKDENIGLLANAIGFELQVEGIEVPVGPYTADILAKDASGNYVVIESQYGKTDHDHLGKMLTYAATLGAIAVVWIAEKFTDEHRKTIEWLNEHTTEELSLYAVELELWQIDQSRPALRLNVLSQPTDISRRASAVKAAGPITDTQKLQLAFWEMFRDKLLAKKVVPSAHTPRPQYWFDVALGRSSILLSNFANTYDGRIGVRVYFADGTGDIAIPQLEAERDVIEAEIGEKLQWNPNPEKRDKTIVLSRKANLSDRSKWPEYCDWLVDKVARFKQSFGPRVKKLDLTDAAQTRE
jgi:hypothetical protein